MTWCILYAESFFFLGSFRFCDQGLERWLIGWEHWLLFLRTQVRVPAPSWQLTINFSYSPRGSSISWALQLLHMYCDQITKYIKIKENFKWLKKCNNLQTSSLAVPPSSGIVSGTRQQGYTLSSNASLKVPGFDNLCNYSLFQFHVRWYYWMSYRTAEGPHKQV